MPGMDYAEARAAFFQPRAADAPPPRTDRWAPTPGRQLRDAIEPIATICFWSEPAYLAYEHRGLDFLQGYVWGRACVLGQPAGSVVAAAFGGFEPGLIAALYDSGRATCTLADIRTAKEAGAIAALRDVLGEPDDLGKVVGSLRRAVEAIPTLAGRPFTAGLTALDWPDEPLGQLWHACSILREYRGDGHVAAYVVAGLDGLEANLLTERQVGWDPLSYTATRGWSAEAMEAAAARLAARGLVVDGELTAAGAALRHGIEQTTDELVQPVVDALGGELPDLTATLHAWSDRIVEHGWFPPDPYKRASG
jgi:hypothetical protein